MKVARYVIKTWYDSIRIKWALICSSLAKPKVWEISGDGDGGVGGNNNRFRFKTISAILYDFHTSMTMGAIII